MPFLHIPSYVYCRYCTSMYGGLAREAIIVCNLARCSTTIKARYILAAEMPSQESEGLGPAADPSARLFSPPHQSIAKGGQKID